MAQAQGPGQLYNVSPPGRAACGDASAWGGARRQGEGASSTAPRKSRAVTHLRRGSPRGRQALRTRCWKGLLQAARVRTRPGGRAPPVQRAPRGALRCWDPRDPSLLRSLRAPGDPGGTPAPDRSLFQELNLGRREEYDVLDKRRGRDPEMGGKQVGRSLFCRCPCVRVGAGRGGRARREGLSEPPAHAVAAPDPACTGPGPGTAGGPSPAAPSPGPGAASVRPPRGGGGTALLPRLPGPLRSQWHRLPQGDRPRKPLGKGEGVPSVPLLCPGSSWVRPGPSCLTPPGTPTFSPAPPPSELCRVRCCEREWGAPHSLSDAPPPTPQPQPFSPYLDQEG